MPASNKQLQAMAGEHAKMVVFSDNVKSLIDFKTWGLKPNITKHNDSINGAESDELGFTFNFWELNGSLYTRDMGIVRAYLKSLQARLDNATPLDQAGGVRFYPQNGTKESLILVDLCWDDFDLQQGGRGSKIMTSVSMRCRGVKEGKAAA